MGDGLILSKLIRCEPCEFSDIRFRMSRYQPDPDAIRMMIEGLTPRNREQASENFVFLTILNP